MNTAKLFKLGIVSLSALFLMAACDGDDTLDTTPVDEGTEQTGGTVGEGTDDTTDDATDESADTTDESATTDDITDTTDSPGIEGMDFGISLDDAIDLFYETFGSEDINIEYIQFDYDDGRYLYEFEGWDEGNEYELDIDAETGEIITQEQDTDDDNNDDILDLADIISPQEAMEAALEASGSGYVEEWELEVENGRTIYDIDLSEGSDQKVDAQTGEIL